MLCRLPLFGPECAAVHPLTLGQLASKLDPNVAKAAASAGGGGAPPPSTPPRDGGRAKSAAARSSPASSKAKLRTPGAHPAVAVVGGVCAGAARLVCCALCYLSPDVGGVHPTSPPPHHPHPRASGLVLGPRRACRQGRSPHAGARQPGRRGCGAGNPPQSELSASRHARGLHREEAPSRGCVWGGGSAAAALCFCWTRLGACLVPVLACAMAYVRAPACAGHKYCPATPPPPLWTCVHLSRVCGRGCARAKRSCERATQLLHGVGLR